MNRLSWITLALTALAAFVAWQLGGSVGAGVFAGWASGTVFTGLALLWQRHQIVHRPERVYAATVQGFLFKLVVLALGAAALRYLAPLAEVADWRGYLVGFGAAVALLAAPGTADNLRLLKSGSKHTGIQEQRAS